MGCVGYRGYMSVILLGSMFAMLLGSVVEDQLPQ